MFGHNVRALNWLSSCLRRSFTFLSWFKKHKKLKRYDKSKLCIPVTDSLFVGNSKTSTYRIRLPFWRNEAALFVRELLGSTFHIWKSNLCNWKHMLAAYFNDLKDEESFVRRTGKLSARFICEYEQQKKKKGLFKSKFSHELGEIKENIFTIVQTMTAYLWSRLWTINNKIFFQMNTTRAFLRKIHIARRAAFLLVLGAFSLNITVLFPFHFLELNCHFRNYRCPGHFFPRKTSGEFVYEYVQ